MRKCVHPNYFFYMIIVCSVLPSGIVCLGHTSRNHYTFNRILWWNGRYPLIMWWIECYSFSWYLVQSCFKIPWGKEQYLLLFIIFFSWHLKESNQKRDVLVWWHQRKTISLQIEFIIEVKFQDYILKLQLNCPVYLK